jgi:hypothetical protein
VQVRKEIEKQYDSLSAQLKKQGEDSRRSCNTLLKHSTGKWLLPMTARISLERKKLNDLQFAENDAQFIATINLDDAKPVLIQVYEAFLQGNMQKVMRLTPLSGLPAVLAELRIKELKLKRERQKAAQQYLLHASAAYRLFQLDEADSAYQAAFLIDSLDPNVLTEYAAFLQIREEDADPIFRGYERALPLYEKAIPLFEKMMEEDPLRFEGDFARALHNAGIIYAQQYKTMLATGYLQRSLELIEKLAEKDPLNYEWKLAHTQATLGKFYKERSVEGDGSVEYSELSDSAYSKAATIYAKLARTGADTYSSSLAGTLEDKGFLYSYAIGDLKKATGFFKDAIAIRRSLAARYPAVYQVSYLYSVMSLSAIYQEAREYDESLKLVKQFISPAKKYLLETKSKKAKDSLSEIVSEFNRQLVKGNIMTGKFSQAETAAKPLLTGNEASWANPFYATALLLQGKNEADRLFSGIAGSLVEKQEALLLLKEVEATELIPSRYKEQADRIMKILLQETNP